jgi:hypothetical protein
MVDLVNAPESVQVIWAKGHKTFIKAAVLKGLSSEICLAESGII